MSTRGDRNISIPAEFRGENGGSAHGPVIDALDAVDLVGLLVDGVHIGEHCIVAALGIDHTGRLCDFRERHYSLSEAGRGICFVTTA